MIVKLIIVLAILQWWDRRNSAVEQEARIRLADREVEKIREAGEEAKRVRAERQAFDLKTQGWMQLHASRYD